MTLRDLVADLERRALTADAEHATAPVGQVYRLVLAELLPLVPRGNGNGATAPRDDAHPDRLLRASDVAQCLGCSVRYVYARAGAFPFTVRVGNLVRFSEHGLERYLRKGAA